MVTLKTEEEEILTFDVSDEALEIAGTDKTNFTWGVCTLDQPGCFPSTDDRPSVARTLRRVGGERFDRAGAGAPISMPVRSYSARPATSVARGSCANNSAQPIDTGGPALGPHQKSESARGEGGRGNRK